MIRAKKATSLSSSSEATGDAEEGEPPNKILLQEAISSVLNNGDESSVLEKFVEGNRDLVAWVGPDPEEVAPFNPSAIGQYSPYNTTGLYQGSERKGYLWN